MSFWTSASWTLPSLRSWTLATEAPVDSTVSGRSRPEVSRAMRAMASAIG